MNQAACRAAYVRFQAHFGDQATRDRIRGMKEEEYQYGFLEDLFERVLGYTLKPKPDYDLVTEHKNATNSKKADGAILRAGEEVHVVIELKGTDTIDLNRVEAQAFGYKVAHADCHYVISSNFERLRFYVDDTTASLEWHLFDLPYEHASRPDFRTLYLVLAKAHLLSDLPLKMRRESTVVEEEVTKRLYKDYSTAKREIFKHLRERHPERDPLRLFQLTQKLLDRLLFVFFGEDKGLLPPNTASKPIGDFDKLRDLDAGQPLYGLLNKYFGYIDRGSTRADFSIPAYNGGLFGARRRAGDARPARPGFAEALTQTYGLQVRLRGGRQHSRAHLRALSQRDRRDPGGAARRAARQVEDQAQERRRLLHATLHHEVHRSQYGGGGCVQKKKVELRIEEEDYARGRKNRPKEKVKALRQNLEAYRQWLLDLKICDPACGSGAFLNEALNFLIEEHNYVSELERQLFDSAIAFEPGPAILERNLYGVDINEEAVEIAKLSLWLRTAERGRKLADLSDKIKVGNSLIDDPAVAGDKAFVWAEEFPEVFGGGTRGGFDVVVGNPPYGANLSRESIEYLKVIRSIKVANDDSYGYFLSLCEKWCRPKGITGLIVPNTFLVVESGNQLRQKLLQNWIWLDLWEKKNVFADAVVEPIIWIAKHESANRQEFTTSLMHRDTMEVSRSHPTLITKDMIEEGSQVNYYIDQNSSGVFHKLKSMKFKLSDISNIYAGVKPYEKGKGSPPQSKEILITKPYTSRVKENDEWLPFYTGSDVARHRLQPPTSYVLYGPWLAAPRDVTTFEGEKLIIRRTDDKILAGYSGQKSIASNSCHVLKLSSGTHSYHAVLTLLSSNLIDWYFKTDNFHMVGKPLAEVKIAYLTRLPLPIHPCETLEIFGKTLEDKYFAIDNLNLSFLRLLSRRLSVDVPTRKLADWPSLTYAEFVREVNKVRKKAKLAKMTLAEDAEWEPHFEKEQAKVAAVRSEIRRLDREIDVAVYKLYGLTWEEVRVVDPEFGIGEREYNLDRHDLQ